MILECDAEMIVCSLEKIYSQKFMEKTFNSLNIQFGQKESEKDELIKVPENCKIYLIFRHCVRP